MPKRSKEETEVTIQTIMDAVVDQLIRLGYDKMSYTTLSQQTGISRTGISHHFPKKTDFIVSLDDRIYSQFISHLNTESDLDSFSRSWISALENSEFVAILRILFHHIVNNEHEVGFAKKGVERLYHLLESHYGESGNRELEWLLGKTLSNMGLTK
ncbi:TetR/AcrR family transcriptional regulator [Vibrio sp. HN007]|uniref:TetR/AcrR family transcriptional regulator n=1 Tax=Vibrio iocasae TaxID=3098914 RepID=UPI0035D4134C